ncbi:MAG: transpeptidase family protein [Candidatus Sumerlaeia bacterium]|nr:transpeptidase family protein [Candidatus Sumerlaeia bacterium]
MFDPRFRQRITVTGVCLAVALTGLIARLYWIQIVRHEYYNIRASYYRIGNEPIRPQRGNIYDRNRRALAAGSLRDTLYANTYFLKQHNIPFEALAIQLESILEKDHTRILAQLRRGGCPPLYRVMPPEISNIMHHLILCEVFPPGTFYFERETKRFYPSGRTASHVLGYVRFDDTGENQGVDGLEYSYDHVIRGNTAKYEVLKDARKGLLAPIDKTYWSSAFGNELILTLDESIQHEAERILRTEVARYRAAWGVIIVQQCKTGAILAMASMPDFDPAAYAGASPSSLRNRAINEPANMGSIMKIFTAAALIETGKLTDLDEQFDCHGGSWYFPPRREPVRDAPGHYLQMASFRDIIRWSSNVGTVAAAQRLERNAYCNLLEKFGFGQKTGIDLPNERQGILRPVSQWTDYTMSAIPYGGEMTVTPIQLVAAVSAIANGGRLMRPYVVKEIRSYEGRLIQTTGPVVVRQVISPVTAGKVLELMEGVVGPYAPKDKTVGGTGKEAAIPGYRVAGKTGTYKYITPAGSDHVSSYTASFVAVLPLPDPEITVFCCIDQPQGAKYGGAVAAPIVRQVAEHALRVLGIPADQPERGPADIPLTIHQARQSQPANGRIETPQDCMPDLRGLTMREVVACMAGLNMELSFEGSGVVVHQEPPPLAPLEGVRGCRIVLRAAGVQPTTSTLAVSTAQSAADNSGA